MRKRLLLAAGGIAALVLIGLVALPFLIDVNQYRGVIQAQLENKLQRKVAMGTVSLRRFPLALAVQDVSIGEDPAVSAMAPFAQAKLVSVKPGMLALLRRQVEVSSLTLEQPTIEVIRKADGTFNFSNLGGKTDAKTPRPALAIDDLEIRNGVVAFTDLKAGQRRTVYDDLDVRLRDFAPGSDFKLYAAAHLPPGEFAFSGQGRDADVLKGKVTLKNVQVSALVRFLNRPGIADSEGILNGAADIDVTKERVAAKGEIAVAKAKVGAQAIDFPVSLRFDATEERAAGMLKIASLQAKLGGNSFGLTGDADLKSSPAIVHLKADKLKGSLTELAHVAALVGLASTPGVMVKGNLDGDVAIDGPVDHAALNGHVQIASFEAAGKGWRQAVKAPAVRLDFDSNTVTAAPMELTCGGTRLSAGGRITGYTTADARVEADLKTNGATVEELLNIAAAVGLSATAGMTGHGGATIDVHASGAAKNPNLAGVMTLDNATVNLPALKRPLTVAHLNMKFADNAAAVDNLAVNLGGANLTGSVVVKNFGAPQVEFAINADKLDVGQLMAVESNAGSKGVGLDKLRGKGTLAAGQLVANGIVLTQLKTTVNLDHGVATLAPLTAGLFGGGVSGSIMADLRPAVPSYRTTLKMTGVDANEMLSALTPVKQRLYGQIVSNGTLTFSGTTEATFTRTLNGTLDFRLANGRLMGVNLMNEVGRVGKFLGLGGEAGNFTKITVLSMALAVRNGIAEASNLRVELDGATIGGGGAINLVDQGLDLRLTASLDKNMSDRVGGRGFGGLMVTVLSAGDGRLVVPVHVTGSIGAPRVEPDAEAFARMKLKSITNPAGIGEAVLGVLDRITGKK